MDVLDALTKDFFARKGNPVEETAELGEVTAHTDRPGYEPISSTLWRQREDYCARLIQSAWRKRDLRGGWEQQQHHQQRGKAGKSVATNINNNSGGHIHGMPDLNEESEDDDDDDEDEDEEGDEDGYEEEERLERKGDLVIVLLLFIIAIPLFVPCVCRYLFLFLKRKIGGCTGCAL